MICKFIFIFSLLRNENINKLIDYITTVPKQENINIEQVNKYAFISCELLCCDTSSIVSKFFINNQYRDLEISIEAAKTLKEEKIKEYEREDAKHKKGSLFNDSDDEDEKSMNKENESKELDNENKTDNEIKNENNENSVNNSDNDNEIQKERMELLNKRKFNLDFCDKMINDNYEKLKLLDENNPELLEYFLNTLTNNNCELLENELLSGYFYRFFVVLFSKNPTFICKYLMDKGYLKTILHGSYNITIAEILSHVVDTTSTLEVDIELEKYLILISEEIFKFAFSLSTNDLIRYIDLYQILATKFLSNKTPMITLLRKSEYLMKIIKNSFCGIDLTKVSTKNYSASIGKVNLADYKKYKKIRLISLEMINNVIKQALFISGEYCRVEECYLQFKPISVKFCIKVLINYYKMIDKFSWFYNDDKKDVDNTNLETDFDKINDIKTETDFLDDEDLNLFYKIYDKTEVVKMFSTISLVLLAKKSMMGNLSKTSVNNSEEKQNELDKSVKEIDESYGFLNQFKNANGEDIIINTIIGEYILKVFPIFAFSYHLTEQKIYISSGCNEDLDAEDPFTFRSTFNEDICIGLGEEKSLLIELFLNLLNYFQSKNAFIYKISDTVKKIIDVSLVSILYLFLGICS